MQHDPLERAAAGAILVVLLALASWGVMPHGTAERQVILVVTATPELSLARAPAGPQSAPTLTPTEAPTATAVPPTATPEPPPATDAPELDQPAADVAVVYAAEQVQPTVAPTPTQAPLAVHFVNPDGSIAFSYECKPYGDWRDESAVYRHPECERASK